MKQNTFNKRRYSETCVEWPPSKRQKMDFKTNHHLMQVKSIAECCPWSILQYFRPSLSPSTIFHKDNFIVSICEWPFYTGFTVYVLAICSILSNVGTYCIIMRSVEVHSCQGIYCLFVHDSELIIRNAKEVTWSKHH